MTDWLGRILVALREARVDLSAEDVADVVWLAPFLEVADRAPEEQTVDSPEEPARVEPHRAIEPADGVEPEPRPAPGPIPEGPRPSGDRRGELHLPGDRAGASSVGGRPLRAPTGSALPGSLALSRALRPLRRRIASRTRRTLDVAETVRRIAEEGIWLPALRPARDRWLELSMVVDVGDSMGPWRSAAKELLGLFSSLGAFRSVRVWSLETDSDPIRLRAGMARPDAARRDPRELVDPAGRSLIVILTDCVAESWSDGQVSRMVEAWARTGPVALLQVLPEQLWARSGLGMASAVRLSAPGPAASNARLHSRLLDPWADPLVRAGSPLPLASLTPQALSSWARVVAGAAGAEVPGFVLDLAPIVEPIVPSSTPTPTPRERLDRFWGAASPTARRLAGLLAASPAITLPVIRLVRQALLPEARQVHEAEVLLGGILRVVEPHVETARDPDEVRYDFRDGVRSLLLDALPAADALEVLGGVSSFVEENLTHGLDFRAMLADPAAARGSIALDEGPFARVAAEVLLRLGGDYARLVAAIPESQSGGTAGPVTPGPLLGGVREAPPNQDPFSQPGSPTSEVRPLKIHGGVLEPRVQITYDVEVDGEVEERELPFVIGVLADLTGGPGPGGGMFKHRRFIEVNRDNFDEFMKLNSPKLVIPVSNPSKDEDAGTIEILIGFGSISDFDPEMILLKTFPLSNWIRGITGAGTRDIDDLILAGMKVEEYSGIYAESRAIERRLSKCLCEILGHPEFRRLESTWRGLHYLVHHAEPETKVRIKVLDVSKRDLAKDQENSVEFDQTSLFACLHQSSFGSDGLEPFGLLVGDFEFDRSTSDLQILEGVSSVAAWAFAPFVAAASPAMFNLDTFAELPIRGDLPAQIKGAGTLRWKAFRDSDDSRYVALTLPRFLGRLPYGTRGIQVGAFPFEERPGPVPHEGYLWVNSAWALAASFAQAMAIHGWPAAIREEDVRLVRGLPVHPVPNDRGGFSAVGPIETAIGDQREYVLARAGFIAMVPAKEGDCARFLSTPSCHRPRLYDQPEANAAALQVAELDVILCVSRVVHYLKVLRDLDDTVSLPGSKGMQALLNRWLQVYTNDDPEASQNSGSRYPLGYAFAEVDQAPGKPGYYRVVLHLKLAWHFDKSATTLLTVFELPGKGA